MAGGLRLSRSASALGMTACVLALLRASAGNAQTPETISTPPPAATAAEPNVVEVKVVGNRGVPTTKVLNEISTRAGRPFDQAMLEKDVRKLASKTWFLDVKPHLEHAGSGVIVVFQVVERPMLEEIKYLGNVQIKTKTLAKQTELKKGDALDLYAIEEGKRKIEEYYKEKGYNHVRVTILEGTKPRDRRVIYLINEGQAQKVWWVKFEGNTIASDARLKTQIQSKPPILWMFKGYLDRKKLDEDKDRLVSYYRSLGFFSARVGCDPQWDENHKWVTLVFYIAEGVRSQVRNVTFIGNTKFTSEQLGQDLKLTGGQYFDKPKSEADIGLVKDLYGSQGYIFADVQAEVRFHEQPGSVDLIYSVSEGDRYRVSRINVHIDGDNPHTRHNVVRNRISLHPGEIVDIRQVRASERRLKASGLFLADPTRNSAPKIVFTPPGGDMDDTEVAGRPRRSSDGFRGQSPDENGTLRSRDRVWVELERVPDVTASGRQKTLPYGKARPRQYQNRIVFGRSPALAGPPASTLSQRAAYPIAPATVRAQNTPSAPRPWLGRPQVQPPARRAPQASPYPNAVPRIGGSTRLHEADEPLVRGQSPDLGWTPQWGQPPRVSSWAQAGSPARPIEGYPSQAVSPAVRPTSDARQAVYQQGSQVVRGQSYEATPVQYGVDDGGARSLSPYSNPYANPYSAYQNPTSPAAGGTPAVPNYVPSPVYQPPAYGPQYAPPVNQFAPPQPAAAPQGQAQSPYYVAPAPQPFMTSQPPPLAPGQQPGVYDGASIVPQGPLGAPAETPDRYIPLDVFVEETQTGRLMFGVGVNSEAGLVGSIVLDEQNFDWRRWPNSFDDFRTGRAFRGMGQRLRIEAAPGTQLQRYLLNFTEPYLFDTPVSFGLSAFYYTRVFRDWNEQRTGGRVSLGYQLTPDLSVNGSLGAQQVEISRPRVPTPFELQDVLGETELYTARTAVVHDTRDSTFLATEGHYIELAFEQGFGSFSFPRGTVDLRQYFLLRERPDGSGRHTLSLISRVGVSGENTPLYEHFFAGGFSTLRGFAFRGASPVDMGVIVGGEFQWLNTIEYLFPITADDMLRGVTFVDFGTVEPTANIDADNFRVAPGFGLRITIPALGPAPIALDFAFPVAKAATDDTQIFSFFVGFGR